ncbi:MAG: hypothetical protein AAGG45_07875 [Pseudomonadota bacterium]
MSETVLARWRRFEPTWTMWAVWICLYGVYSMLIPREHGYDVGHYYVQTGWAALNDRFTTDLAASEMHSFLNPVWNAFLWLLIDHLPGRAVAFILGILQALSLPALYYFTKRLVWRINGQADPFVVLGAALLGFLSGIQALYTGSLVTDGFYTTVMITAFALIMPIGRNQPGLKTCAIASGLIGLSVGLKLTNLLYAIYFAVFVLMLMPTWQARIKTGLICAMAGLLAILLTGGVWAWLMYQEFANPVFPYYNQIFLSPEGPDSGFRDPRYLPGSSLEILWRPFLFLFGEKLNLNQTFYDPRFVLSYVAIFVGLAGVLTFGRVRAGAATRALLAFCIASLLTYLLWALTFSIERYLTVFWLIGPSFVVATVLYIFPNAFDASAGRLSMIAGATLLILMTTPPEVRRVEWESWSEPYVYAEVANLETYENTVIAFTGEYPTAFLAPFLPESAILTSLVSPDWSRPALDNYRPRIRSLIEAEERALYVAIVDLQDHFERTLQRVSDLEGIRVETENCEALKTSFDHEDEVWYLCSAQLLAAPATENTP